MVMLRLWLNTHGKKATGNALEKALRRISRDDIVNKCIFNVELVTDENEQSAAKAALEDVAEFDIFKVRNCFCKRFTVSSWIIIRIFIQPSCIPYKTLSLRLG